MSGALTCAPAPSAAPAASGVIDSVELKAALESLGLSPTDAELQLMMSQLDTDK